MAKRHLPQNLWIWFISSKWARNSVIYQLNKGAKRKANKTEAAL